jgi:glycosyltransferase involved in cell wall biosynthesis
LIATYDRPLSVPPLPAGIEAICISDPPRWFGCREWLRDAIGQADVVKTNQSKGAWDYVRAARRGGKPVLLRCGWVPGFTLQFMGMKPWPLWLYRRKEGGAFRAADACEVSTEAGREWVSRNYGVSRDKIVVSPNWVDLDLFRPAPERSLDRSVVFVGRLEKVKRLDLLIRACGLARVRLNIVGCGNEESSLRALSAEVGADVVFRGVRSQEELPGILHESKVFALSSCVENHPKAMIEAMSCGMACVGTRVPGIENLIQHGVTGWLCDSTPEAMSEGITRLVEDAALRRDLGEKARAYAETYFNFWKIVDAEIRLVEALRSRGKVR